MNKIFSKVMLCGEYSVLEGSAALVIPYSGYYGELAFIGDKLPAPALYESNRNLAAFTEYLLKINWPHGILPDTDLLQEHIHDGLFFDSTIPPQYGLGSSGALVAALFSEYVEDFSTLGILEQKTLLAQAESFFHGKSSGLDPLCAYHNRMLHVTHKTIDSVMDYRNNSALELFHLCDSGQPSATKHLIPAFNSILESQAVRNEFEHYVSSVNALSEMLTRNNVEELSGVMRSISTFQYNNLKPMIPESMECLWNLGLDTDYYYMKLCGSGGGGYVLVYTEMTSNDLSAYIKRETLPLLGVEGNSL